MNVPEHLRDAMRKAFNMPVSTGTPANFVIAEVNEARLLFEAWQGGDAHGREDSQRG